jgi:hypothetical protein
MGKLITLVVLLAAGFGVYRGCFYQSPAYKTYLQWTKATNEGDCKTLNAIADGEAKKWVDGFCNGSPGITVMGHQMSVPSAAGMVADMKNTPQGAMQHFQHEIQSETEAADGTVSLSVIETVLARPSNFSKPAPPQKHDVKLKEIDGVWKIEEFLSKDM